MTDTQLLRQTLKAKRLVLSSAERTEAASGFLSRLRAFFQSISPPKRIGIYLAAKGELDLTPSIEWLWQQGHLLYAPILADTSLDFAEYGPATQLALNQFNLLEPVNAALCMPENLDYVLVPLVAFDLQGNRLGMGKGYYDRTFAFRKNKKSPLLMGCAYAFQQVPCLNAKPHDVKMDQIWLPL